MGEDPRVSPAPAAGPARAPQAFAPVYVPFGVHPRAAVLDALRRALLVAEAQPEETRILFEMHLAAP